MSKIKVNYQRCLDLIEFSWECDNCNKKVYSGLTGEEILVGDTNIICPYCDKEFFVDIENLEKQYNKNNMITKEDLGRFRHFILFAKGWYGKYNYDCFIPKLKMIQSYSTGLDYKHCGRYEDLFIILTDIHKQIGTDFYNMYRNMKRKQIKEGYGREGFRYDLYRLIKQLKFTKCKNGNEVLIELGDINENLKNEIEGVLDND